MTSILKKNPLINLKSLKTKKELFDFFIENQNLTKAQKNEILQPILEPNIERKIEVEDLKR
jgi:hypothetical protein